MYFPVCDGACKRSPAVNEKKNSPCSGSNGFFSHYQNGPLPCLMPINCKIKYVECIIK